MKNDKFFSYQGKRYQGVRRFTPSEAAHGYSRILLRSSCTDLDRKHGWDRRAFIDAARTVGQQDDDIFRSEDGDEFAPSGYCLLRLHSAKELHRD